MKVYEKLLLSCMHCHVIKISTRTRTTTGNNYIKTLCLTGPYNACVRVCWHVACSLHSYVAHIWRSRKIAICMHVCVSVWVQLVFSIS